jgi:hypothetical protein
MRFPRLGVLLLIALLVAALAGACGGNSPGSHFTPGQDSGAGDGTTGDGSSSGDGPTLLGDDGSGDDSGGMLLIQPTNQAIGVVYGQQTPVVNFTATLHGQMVAASFSIDRGEIGSVVASTGVMTPTGNVGGTANVTATYGGQSASTPITVVIHLVDNGAPAGSDAGGGTGGIGGVGGNGTGGPVSNGTQTTLQGTATADPGLAWLYPYDQTVWPRGVLAPLLQWSPSTAGHAYDGIYVQLQETGFQYQGFFAANATPFVNTLIPETAWQVLEYSNMGEPVTVTLVFSSGGTAYGPLTESWKIAQGTLTGTVYYNSYGTSLVTNFCSGTSWGGTFCFGGATLAIKHGATNPALVAGTNSPSGDQTGCRVCHSVAAQGATLVTQHGDNYGVSSAYALTAANAQTVMTGAAGQFAFPGISPDGTFLISGAAPMPATPSQSTSGLFAIPAGTAIASTGLPAGFGAGTPVFSPDAKHIAFNDYTTDGLSLGAMDFTQSTNTFANKVTLHTPTTYPDLFPAFLPTNDAVIFEEETASDGEFGATRDGTRGELWWVDLATKTATRLANLNGAGYLPVGPNSHDQDATLNYEPTVNPVASGGYAWVVFTSRRMYGNVATQDPFLSDPRNYNPATSATTKKLWVAAIDLNAKAGTDPSHPAFYLPAQELLAGNSRGYWVVDPCEANGMSCLTGDQCCSGYCQDVDGGFVCGTQPPGCSALGNKCMTASDCCGAAQGIECIDGFCAQPTPQ